MGFSIFKDTYMNLFAFQTLFVYCKTNHDKKKMKHQRESIKNLIFNPMHLVSA